MYLNHCKAPLFVAIFTILCSVEAAADETAKPTSETSHGVVAKVEHALGRAAKATEKGIKLGANATTNGIERGVTAAQEGVLRAAKETENLAHKVANKINGSSANPSSGQISTDKPASEK